MTEPAKSRIALVLVVLGVACATGLALLRPRTGPSPPEPPHPQPVASTDQAQPAPPQTPVKSAAPARSRAPAVSERAIPQSPVQTAPPPLSKADRLAQLRETFRALATGNPRTALRAARQLTDEAERETALLALVTEWKHGELAPPRQRAWAIASLGLEAGLGLELANSQFPATHTSPLLIR